MGATWWRKGWTRDFVFVGDVARANLLGLRRANNQIINIGTGQETSVNELYRTMAELVGERGKPLYKPARNGELARSVLAPSKARRVLGWTPKVSLKQGLAETIRYFQS